MALHRDLLGLGGGAVTHHQAGGAGSTVHRISGTREHQGDHLVGDPAGTVAEAEHEGLRRRCTCFKRVEARIGDLVGPAHRAGAVAGGLVADNRHQGADRGGAAWEVAGAADDADTQEVGEVGINDSEGTGCRVSEVVGQRIQAVQLSDGTSNVDRCHHAGGFVGVDAADIREHGLNRAGGVGEAAHHADGEAGFGSRHRHGGSTKRRGGDVEGGLDIREDS